DLRVAETRVDAPTTYYAPSRSDSSPCLQSNEFLFGEARFTPCRDVVRSRRAAVHVFIQQPEKRAVRVEAARFGAIAKPARADCDVRDFFGEDDFEHGRGFIVTGLAQFFNH